MAYSKSKAAYPAWVHAFVSTLARATEAGVTAPWELEYSTDTEAKKARFDLYGFINALDRPEPKKGQATQEWHEDQKVARLARQWSISLSQNEFTGKYVLTMKQKNSREALGVVADVLMQMEQAIAQAQGKDATPYTALFASPQSDHPVSGNEEEIEVEQAPLPTLPTPEQFYTDQANKYLREEAKTFILSGIKMLPDPFADYEGKDSFASAFAASLALSLEDFYAKTGMMTFTSRVWDNSRIVKKLVVPMPAASVL